MNCKNWGRKIRAVAVPYFSESQLLDKQEFEHLNSDGFKCTNPEPKEADKNA